MFLILLSVASSDLPWWLSNTGAGAGIIGEDIGMGSAQDTDGRGVTINVIGDGANVFHESYCDRALTDEFIEMRNNAPTTMPVDPEVNVLGTRSLSLALGKSSAEHSTRGVAPGASAASYDTLNVSMEYTLCHHVDYWKIGLITLLSTECSGRTCKYLSTDAMPLNYIDECFYDAAPEDQKVFVVPSGEATSDIFFTLPARWPMMFSVGPVDNRGKPIGDSAEGSALFILCPSVAESKSKRSFPDMVTALPISNTSYSNESFYDSYGAAAVFAGGLAVILEKYPALSVTDLFYLVAMTATKVEPDSLLWQENAYGLAHNRKAGFGRLNVKGVLDAVEYLNKTGFRSLGNFYKYETPIAHNINLDLSGETESSEVTVPINITDVDDPRVMQIIVCLNTKNLGFGSLTLSMVSPNSENEYILKILTYSSDVSKDIVYFEFPSYQLLGEKANGNWTIRFPKIDSVARGLIVSIGLKVYYSNGAFDNKIIDLYKKDGKNPFIIDDSINTGAFVFNESKVVLEAGKNVSLSVNVKNEYKNCPVTVYLHDEDNKHRIKTSGVYKQTQDGDFIYLDYVPSIYENRTKMHLVVESKHSEICYFQSSVPVDYIHNFENNSVYLPDYPDGIIFKNTTEFRVNWNLNLSNVLDDGYSTSTCITIISPESKRILRRSFTRNTGSATFSLLDDSEKPSNSHFILEVSPSSNIHKSEFPSMNLYIKMSPENGESDKYESPITNFIIILIIVIFALNLFFIGYTLFRIYQKKTAEEKEENELLMNDENVED